MRPARSNTPEVRNPLMRVPEIAAIFATLDPAARAALRTALLAFSKHCRATGNECWRKHKPPMAAYWKAWAVNSTHAARLLK